MPVMTFDEYYNNWLEDHAYNDSTVVKGWLKFSYFVCDNIFLPLKFTPLRIDFLSLGFSLLIVVLFSLFPYLNDFGLLTNGFLIIFLMLSIGMMDNLDGMIARLTRKKSPSGSYQDLIFDRINDGIILISPIFSTYTRIGSVLFLLFTVFIFENLRSIHVSAGIPLFSTLAERHARLIFQIGYIGISSCGFYLVSLGWCFPITIYGKIIPFWPNLDILYICMGLVSIIGIIQLIVKIARTKMISLKLTSNRNSMELIGENELNGSSNEHNETSRVEFKEAFEKLIFITNLYEYRLILKRSGYFQGKILNRIAKNPMILFLIILSLDLTFFFMLIVMLAFKSLNITVEIISNVILITFFLFFIGNLKKILNYSGYKKKMSIHCFIFCYLLDLVLEVTLLVIVSFTISSNVAQIFVIYCLAIQLCHAANILNQRRKVRENKSYFPRALFDIINFISLFGILFNLIFQNPYFIIGLALLLLFLLVKNIHRANSFLRVNLDLNID